MVLDIFCIIQIIQLIKRDSRQNRKNMVGQFHVKQILKMCFTNKKNITEKVWNLNGEEPLCD